jgi:hypothetical protein
MSRSFAYRLALIVCTFAAVLAITPAGAAAADRWSIVVSTAPTNPQDIWFAASGSNASGWLGGGNVCLVGPLAQGLGVGDHATIKLDVVSAGIFGVDGTPVAPGTYVAPAGTEFPARTFEMVVGRTFFVITRGFVVESNLPFLPKGTTTSLMLTFDTILGRTSQDVVAWTSTPAGFVPFLNEGVMMTNLRRR